MRRTAAEGVQLLWEVNPAFPEPEDPNDPTDVPWNEDGSDIAAVKAPFTLPINRTRFGNFAGAADSTSNIEVMHLAFGFKPDVSDAELKALPIYGEPTPKVLLEPVDQEVRA